MTSSSAEPATNVSQASTTTTISLLAPRAQPASPTGNWQLPVGMSHEFYTYIDHGCTLDGEGYPLYPNGNTTYVLKPGVSIKNFGSVGFTRRNNHERSKNQQWTTIRPNCLGVLLCYKEQCDYAGSPPTGHGKIKEHIERNLPCPGSAGRCTGKVYWQQCTNTQVRFDFHKDTGWALLRHHGLHDHRWPTPKKPDPLSFEAYARRVKKNPDASALKLKLGITGDPSEPFESVVDIHESLGNSDRARYYRRIILEKLHAGADKKRGGADRFILDMIEWDQRGLTTISSSFRRGEEHFTFQTPWMSERLLERREEDDENKINSGGLISDVTYKFFLNGYLLTTSMYCEDISRWIPIQFSWIRGLSQTYYTLHFTALFRQFLNPDLQEHEQKLLAINVVDFSQAQQNGFAEAYTNTFGGTREEAIGALKGCREHFRQSITRVARNRAIIKADEQIH
ncbi:hypothetical protein PSTG_06278 [Puccinia striiformis f. sp. tritici PST-78]|uniref:GCM domain-containing protein n=1 Tax=Puccinia striiformis f. sp. tritici PST-78 TaxID=1165861 RepID=A0A0L0VNK0_9BASI|nr:hypothetical protein PSTG_06278 [Puccinia striiformis f. sp. tritici PST-78]